MVRSIGGIMKAYLVARGESVTVRVLRDGEVTEDPILHELHLDGFGAMGELIASQPHPDKWVKVLEVMLRDLLKQGVITGAALMCGKSVGITDAAREQLAAEAIAAGSPAQAEPTAPSRRAPN